MPRVLRFAAVSAMSMASAPGLRAQAERGRPAVVVGRVVDHDGGGPLAFSVVTDADGDHFADERGRFTVASGGGRVRLRVRHVGFAPVDTSVDVGGGAADTVVVRLSRVAVRLDAVQVAARAPCVDSDIASTDSAFGTVLDQVRLNADEYRLFTTQYPFHSAIEVTKRHQRVDGLIVLDHVDTILARSEDHHVYRRGEVLQSDFASGESWLEVPTLVDFADPAFVGAHCFSVAGIETVDGASYVRVDFEPLDAIHAPDIAGSLYLTSRDFEIRRADFRLSRAPSARSHIASMEIITIFRDAVPSVPVVSNVWSIDHLVATSDSRATAVLEEEHRLLDVNFPNGLPGGRAPAPKHLAGGGVTAVTKTPDTLVNAPSSGRATDDIALQSTPAELPAVRTEARRGHADLEARWAKRGGDEEVLDSTQLGSTLSLWDVANARMGNRPRCGDLVLDDQVVHRWAWWQLDAIRVDDVAVLEIRRAASLPQQYHEARCNMFSYVFLIWTKAWLSGLK